MRFTKVSSDVVRRYLGEKKEEIELVELTNLQFLV